jgi:CheY-like chemotaxis protein
MSARKTSRPSILVVDDDPRNLLAFEVLLAALDADLTLVGSGDAALRELLKHRYDLVLLDVHMPGLDGFATARLIRTRPSAPQILFVSAQDDPRGRTPADDFVRKPFDPDEFLERLSSMISGHKQEVAYSAPG